jgi:sulfonate transport system permease protein
MRFTDNIVAIVKERYRGVISFAVLFLVWEEVTRLGLVSPEKLPAPALVSRTLAELIGSGLLLKSLASSLVRIAEGFLVGTTLGFLVGGFMGISATAELVFSPLVNAARQVPIIGWIPLIVLWCGVEDLSKVTFIAVGAFFPMMITTFRGVRSVPQRYLEVVRVFEYGKLRLFRSIVVPGALPDIVTGIRLSLGTSWMLVVWSEINTRSGLGIGEMLWSARMASKLDVVIVCIAVIGLVAWLINELLGGVEARLLVWKRKES